jgi:hypothetical protein
VDVVGTEEGDDVEVVQTFFRVVEFEGEVVELLFGDGLNVGFVDRAHELVLRPVLGLSNGALCKLSFIASKSPAKNEKMTHTAQAAEQ